MSELLRAYGAVPVEVPTIAVEPPRTPTQMERAVKGLVTGRYEWIVFTSTNAVRAVREKFEEFGLDARAFAGVKIACVGESTADAVRGVRHPARAGALGRAVQRGPAGRLPAVRRGARPDRPRAAAAGRHRHRDPGRRPARAGLGDRRRDRLPDGAGRAAGRRDPRRDQVGWLPGRLLHLVVHGAQPGRDRRQAARPHRRRGDRPAHGRDRGASSGCAWTCSPRRRRCRAWSQALADFASRGPRRTARRRSRPPPARRAAGRRAATQPGPSSTASR